MLHDAAWELNESAPAARTCRASEAMDFFDFILIDWRRPRRVVPLLDEKWH